MNALEVLEKIKTMENEERWKLLDSMYDEYYNSNSNLEGDDQDEI